MKTWTKDELIKTVNDLEAGCTMKNIGENYLMKSFNEGVAAMALWVRQRIEYENAQAEDEAK